MSIDVIKTFVLRIKTSPRLATVDLFDRWLLNIGLSVNCKNIKFWILKGLLFLNVFCFFVEAPAAPVCHGIYDNNLHQQHHIQTLLEKAQESFPAIVADFIKWAHFYHASFFARIKSEESLSAKPAIRSNENQPYTLDHVRDTVGLRFILPIQSPLLKTQNKHDLALLLGMSTDQSETRTQSWKPYHLLSVKAKGTDIDQQNNKFYRATHLTMQDRNGLKFELQLMSRFVADWHSWDHDLVYKPRTSNPEYLKNVKKYSLAWIHLITLLEDIYINKANKNDLVVLLKETLNMKMDLRNPHWLLNFDHALISTLQIQSEDQFFHEYHDNKITVRKQAAKDLLGLSTTVF